MSKSTARAKRSAGSRQALVIVESPAKAKTIGKYLGPGFTVEASIGHIRDLPQNAKEIPAQYKDQPWRNLGVNVNDNFAPIYVIPPGKSKQIKLLKDRLKSADALYLATDEDREGEAISWHLLEVLKPKVPVHRLVFHEITKDAIHDALQSPRAVDDGLVRAQETRRILDRLYGYEVSPLLWRKVRPKLSAGRVQSVAVRLLVERERERMAFVSAAWSDLLGKFAKASGQVIETALVSVDGRRIPTGKDFDSSTGKIKDPKLMLLDAAAAADLAKRIASGKFRVSKVDVKPYTSRPSAPFTTSTLQQEANRKLGFTARRTMQVAQSLYENGHITYMRTDSTNLAQVAIDDARRLVAEEYGNDFLSPETRIYKSKVKNAQEAHEAIRPAGHPFALPGTLRSVLGADEFKLFDMIWKRTIASQMADARGRRITIVIEGEGCVFQATGKTIDFEVGEALRCVEMLPKEHTTQPPGRYSEAALTKALEEKGIGRPSTYASIIDTIQNRNYAFKKGGALVPTWVAFSVVQLLEEHLASLVDYQFTAQMEDDLDAISRGEREYVEYLKSFYFGDGRPGLKPQLENKGTEIDARDISRIWIGTPPDGTPVYVRVGRYSPFVEQGERTASLTEETPPDEVTLDFALQLLEQSKQSEEPLGTCPQTGKPVYLKVGRFGPYVQRGKPDDEEKPQNASLLKGMTPQDVDLAMALKLLSLPRNLGPHPQLGEQVTAFNGRFGPYVKCGEETRSLPADLSPLDVTLAQAAFLLAQPKTRGRGRAGAKREPLKVFDASPVTGEKVQLLDGRFGPYVADGQTNASLPKGTSPDELTFDEALALLAARAAAGPSKRKAPRRKSASASTSAAAPKKKAATKRHPAKAAAKSPKKRRKSGD
jgi:DNA topoisomerase-1